MVRFALVALFSCAVAFGMPVYAGTVSASTPVAKKAVAHTSGKKRVAKKSAKAVATVLSDRKKHQRKSGAISKTSVSARSTSFRRVAFTHKQRGGNSPSASAKSVLPAIPAVLSVGDAAGLGSTQDPLDLKSNVALVLDTDSSKVLFEKNSQVALPIASLTKLMTSLVVVEAHQDMDEVIEITPDDIDHEKNTHSRLWIGARMTRANLLHIALMSSENRAASALGRNYPGGLPAFVAAMNAKARALGMHDTHYVEPTGLSSQNVASARDLAKLVVAAHHYPVINQFSTDEDYLLDLGQRSLQYRNSNRLVRNPDWDIGLQKTGYISEAGRCLVMLTKISGRSIVMVFLDSKGKLSRIADAGRIRKWVANRRAQQVSDIERMLNEG